jgi:hypothetical protein
LHVCDESEWFRAQNWCRCGYARGFASPFVGITKRCLRHELAALAPAAPQAGKWVAAAAALPTVGLLISTNAWLIPKTN